MLFNHRLQYFYAGLLSLLIFSSCSDDDHVRTIEEPLLVSFEFRKDQNPHLNENVIFTRDSVNCIFEAIYLKWIDYEKPYFFIPTFTFVGDKILINGQEVVSNVTPISFAEDVICEVISSGNIKRYTISFICPQINTELPVMHFLVPCDSIKDKEHYVETLLTFYDKGDIIWSSNDGPMQIRGRGNTTWNWPKKPYKLKLPKKVDPFKTGKSEKEWVILAHDMDKSLIRNHLGFKVSEVLFEKTDTFHHPQYSCFTPSSKFVNVYFNDSYHGVYQLTDHKERGKNRIDVEKLGVDEGDDDHIICGGHILEVVSSINEPSINFRTNKGIIIDHKYPKEDNHTAKQWRYIEDYVNTAEAVLYSDSYSEKETGWRQFFDEKSLANYIVVKEFCGDMDGYISTMLYKKRDCNLLFFGPVWDMDKAWGNDVRVPFEDYPPLSSLMIFGGFRMHYNSDDWYGRFWNDEGLRKLVSKRYFLFRDKLLDVVNKELDLLPVQMRKSIAANWQVWPHDYQECIDAPTPEKNYDDEIKKIRNQINIRVELLDNLFH